MCQQAQNTAALLDHCVVSALNPFVDIAPRCGCCVMGSERSLTSYVEDVRCVGNSLRCVVRVFTKRGSGVAVETYLPWRQSFAGEE